ncbi:hypothetical protein [Nodosilinea sp. LEGE 06152]|uniref:hypothetical protein n=1 Tax=Nodosilinea sp. LEGE 06152 TaxID=2777966 RepID=UPI001D15DBE1|nr:hypothetical protein [Nodosilinea sp. LEGE 06152]
MTIFRYWQLLRITSAGECQAHLLSHVQDWLQQAFADSLSDTEAQASNLQKALLDRWRSKTAQADLALLSLRCFVSHQIRDACHRLAQKFGHHYGFTTAELLAVVLDDDGRSPSPHRPFTQQILESYDPDKAALSTWSSRLTCNHPELDQLLLQKGLYRVSDWAILNDTSLEQAKKILRTFHLCSEYEVTVAVALLEQYQRVYCRDRLAQRQNSGPRRCPTPTDKQLKEMAPGLAPNTTLRQLRDLASLLRQYRISVRTGGPHQPEAPDWEQVPDATPVLDEQEEFLAAFRQAVQQGLDGAIAQVIAANIHRLSQKKTPEDSVYVQGLHRFYCLGQTIGALASELGLGNFARARRLLDLQRLRADVRHRLIPTLYDQVRQEAVDYSSPEQLHQLDQTLEAILAEHIDSLIAEDAAAAQSPHRSGPTSLFAQQLCATIHQFMPDSE